MIFDHGQVLPQALRGQLGDFAGGEVGWLERGVQPFGLVEHVVRRYDDYEPLTLDRWQRLQVFTATAHHGGTAAHEKRDVGAELGGESRQLGEVNARTPERVQADERSGRIARAAAEARGGGDAFLQGQLGAGAYPGERGQQLRGALDQVGRW